MPFIRNSYVASSYITCILHNYLDGTIGANMWKCNVTILNFVLAFWLVEV